MHLRNFLTGDLDCVLTYCKQKIYLDTFRRKD